ncbi:hypothetical protein TeGR_g5213, partial [Tetraparma gracilis]
PSYTPPSHAHPGAPAQYGGPHSQQSQRAPTSPFAKSYGSAPHFGAVGSAGSSWYPPSPGSGYSRGGYEEPHPHISLTIHSSTIRPGVVPARSTRLTMPGVRTGVALPRLTARAKKQVIEDIEELMKRGDPLKTAVQTVADNKASYPDRFDGSRPFSRDSAVGWLKPETKQNIFAKAEKEPASDSQYARPEQQEPELAAPGLTKERTKASIAASRETDEYKAKEKERMQKDEYKAKDKVRKQTEEYKTYQHGVHESQREDNLQRDQLSASLEEDMLIADIWRVSRAAAEDLFKLYREEHERLHSLGRHAAAYTGLATGRTLGGCLPGDGEQVVYGQGWGGETLPEASPLDHTYEEFRHWCAGDSLQRPGGGGGLPLAWCRENVKVLAVELPNKVCLKVTEMWLHTLIFRFIRSGKLRSLIYQPLPDASYAGLLACETLISAGKTNIPGKGVVFLTFVEGVLDLIREGALEVKQGRLGRNLPGDVDVEGMQERAADWEERDTHVSEASSDATAPPPAARGDHLHFVLESATSGRVMSEHGKHWVAKVDDEPWDVDGRRRGWMLTICYGSGRGALRGKVPGRGAQQINLLCSSLEVAVREAWKQADAKLHQGRSDRCGPDSKVDLYDLIMGPRRPAALEPAGKRARLK